MFFYLRFSFGILYFIFEAFLLKFLKCRGTLIVETIPNNGKWSSRFQKKGRGKTISDKKEIQTTNAMEISLSCQNKKESDLIVVDVDIKIHFFWLMKLIFSKYFPKTNRNVMALLLQSRINVQHFLPKFPAN